MYVLYIFPSQVSARNLFRCFLYLRVVSNFSFLGYLTQLIGEQVLSNIISSFLDLFSTRWY